MGGRDYIYTRDTRCGGQSMRAFLLKLMNLCVLIFCSIIFWLIVRCFSVCIFLRREGGLVLIKKLYREKYENGFVQDEPPLYWIQNEHSCVSYLSIRDVTRGLQSHSEKTLSLHNSNLQYEITRYQ